MDIDEFLDREFFEINLQAEKTEKQEGVEPLRPKVQEQSMLGAGIKSGLSKDSIEEAEQSYLRLWQALMEQKLKWNKELYDQMLALGRQLSSALSAAYDDITKKAERIKELINKARAYLMEGRRDIPFKLYSEMQEINNKIPNVFFEEKKGVQEQIMDFYKELKNATDNDLIKRVVALLQEINQLIDKISASISSNDIANAVAYHNKCIELYNQIPEGFLRYKLPAGMKLLEIYKTLGIYTGISTLQRQLTESMPRSSQIQRASPSQQAKPAQQANNGSAKSNLLSAKKEHAKKNIQKGLYAEANKSIQEALELEPNDAEAKVMHAKIKTLI